MANQLGKMYICSKCGSQVIVTKSGTGTLKCCGQGMEQKK
jgi:desulfoferrodoxin-like iron-binding protein